MRKTEIIDVNPIIGWLYEIYSQSHSTERIQIQSDFDQLYESMNGMPLQEVDHVIYPVCTLCLDHERYGFVEGVKIGFKLVRELDEVQG